jgi:CheY-like chemotaxis protein
MKTTMPDLEKIWSHHPGIMPVAFVYGDSDCSGPYRVTSISIGGVVLSGRSPLKKNTEVQVLLLAPGQRQMTIEGWVIHQERLGEGEFASTVAFCQVVSGVHPAGNEILPDEIGPPEEPQEALVLVVDDSLGICRALKRDLKSLGYRAVYAVTTVDAIMLLLDPQVPIKAVVVDLFMGPDDGLEILDFLARWFPDIRRVLISGQVRMEQLNLARKSGRVQAVLQKPWSRDDLARALESPGIT